MYLPSQGAYAEDGWSYRGSPVVFLGNEHMRVTVLPDKGGDISSIVARPADIELLWRSPNAGADPVRHVAATGHPEATWLDLYEGGWQSVFPNGGWASSYAGADLGLHAESAMVPWQVRVVDLGPHVASLRADVALTRTPLRATRTLTLEQGSSTLVVDEVVTNASPQRFPMSYGQHIVFGPPFLSPACRVELPDATVRAHPVQTSDANTLIAGGQAGWPHAPTRDGSTRDLRNVLPATAGTEDLAYLGDLADGWYAITNLELGVGVAVRFPADLYRYIWRWEVFGGGGGYPWWGRTYSLGMELFTSATTLGLSACIEDGSAVWLEAGESTHSRVLVTLFSGSDRVVGVDENGAVEFASERVTKDSPEE